MLVGNRMTLNPITVSPQSSVAAAMTLMREKNIRRLPVIDSRGQLVGIVSDRDILQASPSPATSLARWELPELLDKLTIDKIMTADVVSIPEDTPLEEAARIMADHKVGGLPVLRGAALVGIITESDLFKVLLQLLGGRRPGVRISVATPGDKGTVARITAAVFAAGGNIVGFGISEREDNDDNHWVITLKVQEVSREKLVEVIGPVVTEILDVRMA
ncbi:MAG: CBS domain-containing protein [Desulfobacteraceae bacterium]|nr:CBS domain-containing protein [Desulfobacteraceae bacterium]